MELRLATAGESHGPALVAIVTGLPAGLELDRDAIDARPARRQQGYGRSPRQQIETDEVEVLAGLRQGRTLGTPLALVVANRDHKNWTWGMSPWPPEGEPTGKGTKPVTLPRPGHADLSGRAEVRARRRARRARARERPPHRGARRGRRRRQGAARARSGSTVAGEALEVGGARGEDGDPRRDRRGARRPGHARRDRRGARRRRAARARLVRRRRRTGSTRALPHALDGHPGRQGRRDRRRASRSRGLRGSAGARRDLPRRAGFAGDTNRAGGIEARHLERRGDRRPRRDEAAADADEAARARSTSPRGEPAEALVERSDIAAVEALAVVAEAAVAFELGRAAKEKFGGDAIGDFVAAHRAYVERIDWRRASPQPAARRRPMHALGRHLALIGFMGAGKSHGSAPRWRSASAGRSSTSTPRSRPAPGCRSPEIFAAARRGAVPRARGASVIREALSAREPAVLALGGGALGRRTRLAQGAARAGAHDPGGGGRRRRLARASRSGQRPLARDEERFRAALRRAAAASTRRPPTRVARDLDGVVLAAGGVHVAPGRARAARRARPGRRPGRARRRPARASASTAPPRSSRSATRLVSTHELPAGEEAKTAATLERLWGELAARPPRHARRARRRLHDRRRRVRRRHLPARRSPGSSVPTTLVGQVDAGDRRQDGDQPRREGRTSSAPSTGRPAS